MTTRETKKAFLIARITSAQKESLKDKARQRGLTVSQLVREIILNFLNGN